MIFGCVHSKPFNLILDASIPLGSPRQTHSGHSLTTSAKSLSNAQKILEADEFNNMDDHQGMLKNPFFFNYRAHKLFK